jgi:tetratricopeptide (TPR) repeat protein
LIGVEPVRNVVLMEDHDGAYYAWKQAELRDRIAVHIDAHIDFGWIPERDPVALLNLRTLREIEEASSTDSLWNFTGRPADKLVNLGNYLNPALREGIVRSVYWVAPDGFFATPRRRTQLQAMLHDIRKSNPHALREIAWTSGALHAELYGKRLTICPVSEIPHFDEEVLLDIDTDFLITASISPTYPFPALPNTTPWIWPDELVAKLRERRLRAEWVTIAYSVQGGFTPLGYKYLADDLASLIRDPRLSPAQRELRGLKAEAGSAQDAGKLEDARERYARALTLNPGDASIHYRLAQVTYELGEGDEARRHFEQAIRLDPSYRTEYNNFGPVYLVLGRFAHAAAEYREILTLDPHNARAQRGLGDVSQALKRWAEAMAHYRRAIDLAPDDGHAHLGLGRGHVRSRNWASAEAELTLAARSHECEGAAQYWLGYVYAKQRRWDDALTAYKTAKRQRFRPRGLYPALGNLYLRKGNLYQATRHYGKAARLLTAELRHRVRRLLTAGRRRLTTRLTGNAAAR